MGLDMYLFATPKGAGPNRYRDEEEVERELAKLGEDASYDERMAVHKNDGVLDLGYWRKANHIHAWFVEHVQGGEDECNPFLVHPESLADLMQRCQEVIADPSKGPELLPTQGGFFFGSTEYDEWYLSNIEKTVQILEGVLENARGMDVYYQSSW